MNKWTACTAHSNNPQHYPCVCICAAEASTLPLCLETSMFIWSRDLGDGLWGHPVYQLKVNCSTVLTLWFNLLYRVDSYSGHGEGKKTKTQKTTIRVLDCFSSPVWCGQVAGARRATGREILWEKTSFARRIHQCYHCSKAFWTNHWTSLDLSSVPLSGTVTSQSCDKDWTWSVMWSISYLRMLLFPSSVVKEFN